MFVNMMINPIFVRVGVEPLPEKTDTDNLDCIFEHYAKLEGEDHDGAMLEQHQQALMDILLCCDLNKHELFRNWILNNENLSSFMTRKVVAHPGVLCFDDSPWAERIKNLIELCYKYGSLFEFENFIPTENARTRIKKSAGWLGPLTPRYTMQEFCDSLAQQYKSRELCPKTIFTNMLEDPNTTHEHLRAHMIVLLQQVVGYKKSALNFSGKSEKFLEQLGDVLLAKLSVTGVTPIEKKLTLNVFYCFVLREIIGQRCIDVIYAPRREPDETLRLTSSAAGIGNDKFLTAASAQAIEGHTAEEEITFPLSYRIIEIIVATEDFVGSDPALQSLYDTVITLLTEQMRLTLPPKEVKEPLAIEDSKVSGAVVVTPPGPR